MKPKPYVPRWDAEMKRTYIAQSFIQPMKFKGEKINIKDAPKEKVEEIFSLFFYGVK